MTKNRHGRGDKEWESNLIQRHREGDPQATQELYDTHKGALICVVNKFCNLTGWNRQEAMSVASVAFVEALKTCNVEKSRFITWLWRLSWQAMRRACKNDMVIAGPVGNNESTTHAEIRNKLRRGGSFVERVPTCAVRNAVEDSDDMAIVRLAFEELDSRERLIVYRRVVDGVTQAAIGRDFGFTRQYIQLIERRAMRKLRCLCNARDIDQ